jgi:hypothetical protein
MTAVDGLVAGPIHGAHGYEARAERERSVCRDGAAAQGHLLSGLEVVGASVIAAALPGVQLVAAARGN